MNSYGQPVVTAICDGDVDAPPDARAYGSSDDNPDLNGDGEVQVIDFTTLLRAQG